MIKENLLKKLSSEELEKCVGGNITLFEVKPGKNGGKEIYLGKGLSVLAAFYIGLQALALLCATVNGVYGLSKLTQKNVITSSRIFLAAFF